MTVFNTFCPHCESRLSLAEHQTVGTHVSCPRCRRNFTVERMQALRGTGPVDDSPFCPSCQTALTSREKARGICPVCKEPLGRPSGIDDQASGAAASADASSGPAVAMSPVAGAPSSTPLIVVMILLGAVLIGSEWTGGLLETTGSGESAKIGTRHMSQLEIVWHSAMTVVYLLMLVVMAGIWKTFEKAGQPGWGILVPIYSIILILRIADKPRWWWIPLVVLPVLPLMIPLLLLFGFYSMSALTLLIAMSGTYVLASIVCFVLGLLISLAVAARFERGAGFGVGLSLLPFIFYPILGFGSAKYARREDELDPDLYSPADKPSQAATTSVFHRIKKSIEPAYLLVAGITLAVGLLIYFLWPRYDARDNIGGFDSPQALFEYMQTMEGEDPAALLQCVPPDERPLLAYMQALGASFISGRTPEATKDWKQILSKYDLKLEASTTPGKMKENAAKAFKDIKVEDFMTDMITFFKKHEPSMETKDDGDSEKFVEMKGLKIQGDEATATLVKKSGERQHTVFRKVKGRWFWSIQKTLYPEESDPELANGSGISVPVSYRITFVDKAAFDRADANSLLKTVIHERSAGVHFRKYSTTLRAFLAFHVPLGEKGSTQFNERLQKVPGVKKAEMIANLDEEGLTFGSTDDNRKLTLIVTFREKQFYDSADKAALLKGVFYNRMKPVTTTKIPDALTVKLNFWFHQGETTEDEIITSMKMAPGVKTVEAEGGWPFGQAFHNQENKKEPSQPPKTGETGKMAKLIIGSWEKDETKSTERLPENLSHTTLVVTLGTDGKITEALYYKGKSQIIDKTAYKVDGNKLTWGESPFEKTYTIARLSDTELVLQGRNRLVFRKFNPSGKQSPPSKSSQRPSVVDLSGKWLDSHGGEIVITQKGNQVTAVGKNAAVLKWWTTGTATLKGKTLTMTHRKGQRVTDVVSGTVVNGDRINWRNDTYWKRVTPKK